MRLARSLELELQRLEPLALLLDLPRRLVPLVLRPLPLLQHRRQPLRLLQRELETPHLHIWLQPVGARGCSLLARALLNLLWRTFWCSLVSSSCASAASSALTSACAALTVPLSTSALTRAFSCSLSSCAPATCASATVCICTAACSCTWLGLGSGLGLGLELGSGSGLGLGSGLDRRLQLHLLLGPLGHRRVAAGDRL